MLSQNSTDEIDIRDQAATEREVHSFLLQAETDIFVQKSFYTWRALSEHRLPVQWLNLIPQEDHGAKNSHWQDQTGEVKGIPHSLTNLLVEKCRKAILDHLCLAIPALKVLFPEFLNGGVSPTRQQLMDACRNSGINLSDGENLPLIEKFGWDSAYAAKPQTLIRTLRQVLDTCFYKAGPFYLKVSLMRSGSTENQPSTWRVVVTSMPGVANM
jgi:hypothetical protein